MAQGFLANKTRAAATATPSAPAARDPNRYSGLRVSNDTAKLLKGDYGVTLVSAKQEHTRSGDMWILALDVTSAAEGSANLPGPVEMGRPVITQDQRDMVVKICLGICMAATGHTDEQEFFAAFPAGENGEGSGADLIDRVMGYQLEETFFGPNPLAGAEFRVECFDSNKIEPKTGRPYINQRWYPKTAQ
jgi:hypothetical protein